MEKDFVTYFYGRVSTREQNTARQEAAADALGIDTRHRYFDKITGKTFDRKNYNLLVGTHEAAPLLRKGDLLVIYSIDRLGRNYNEIMEQWRYITQTLQANIKVVDMPLLDTSRGCSDLDTRFVADLVLQILSYVANKELENNKTRREVGMKEMVRNGSMDCVSLKVMGEDGKPEPKKKLLGKSGKPQGRPAAEFPANWKEVYDAWKSGDLKATEAMERLGTTKNTFYNLVKRYTA